MDYEKYKEVRIPAEEAEALRNLEEQIKSSEIWGFSTREHRTIKFHMKGKGLSNFVPFQSFERLQELKLTAMTIPDLSFLKDLKSLKTLNLKSTNITDLSPITHLKKLVHLNIKGTGVSDLSPLQNLEALRYLNIGRTQISDLSPIGNLKNMEKLYAKQTNISDITPLRNLDNLKRLSLGGTQVTDLSPLRSLKTLRKLWLWSTPITNISSLRDLKHLKLLNLKNTKITNISPLQKLTSLRTLNLEFTNISDISPLQYLTNLRKLNLIRTNISDFSPLQHLENIQTLELRPKQEACYKGYLHEFHPCKKKDDFSHTIDEMAVMRERLQLVLENLYRKEIPNQEYTESDVEHLCHTLIQHQRNDLSYAKHSWSVLPTNSQNIPPHDARASFIFKPTYLAISILTRVLLDYPSISEQISGYEDTLREGYQFVANLPGPCYSCPLSLTDIFVYFRMGGVLTLLSEKPNFAPQLQSTIQKLKVSVEPKKMGEEGERPSIQTLRFKESIRSAVTSALRDLNFDKEGKRKSRTFKHLSTVLDAIIKRVISAVKHFPKLTPPSREDLTPIVKDALKRWEEEKMAKIQWNTKTKPVYPAIQLNRRELSFLTPEWKWDQEKAIISTLQILETYLLEQYKETLAINTHGI